MSGEEHFFGIVEVCDRSPLLHTLFEFFLATMRNFLLQLALDYQGTAASENFTNAWKVTLATGYTCITFVKEL